ncbi:MAG: PAS domain S-box protein [Candidatus Edwardsbacteria bacterium]|jgi:PAS domain S-box-containing protein|nr:PAS domain S-box protein [Candidatus Edwardsbacteria bacterium]
MKKRAAARPAPQRSRRTRPAPPAWLAQIAAQVGEAVAVADLSGALIFVNRAWAEMHGYRERELIGKTIGIGHTDRQLAEQVRPFNQRVLELGRWTGEVGHRRKDGTTFLTEMTTTLFRDGKGKPLGFIGFARDITEQRRIQQRLAESEHKYRALADALPQTVFEADLSGRIIYANRTALEQFGYGPADLRRGLAVSDMIAPADRQRAAENFGRRLAGGAAENQEYAALRRDGSTFPVNIYARPVERDGAVAGLRGIIVDITEHKRSEGALQESEQKFRSLAETSPSGIFAYRETFIYVNPACLALTGYSEAELLGMPFWQLAHPDHQEMVRERGLARQRGESPPAHYEFKIVRKDGGVRWVDFTATVVRFQGSPAGMGIVFDITERTLTEERLRQSEAFSRAMIENSPVGFAVRNRRGQLLMYNKAWVKIWGMTPRLIMRHTQEMTPQRFREIFDHLGPHLAAVERIFAVGGSLFIPELKVTSPHPGGAQWVRQYFYTVPDQRGEVDRIVVMTDDITERKTAWERLRQSEGRFETLASISPVGIFRTDAAGSTSYVNPRWCQISGLTPREAMGDGWLNAVHPDDREQVRSGWDSAVNAQASPQVEYRFIRRDGSTAWVIGQAVPEHGADGRIAGYVGTITDITALKQAAAELQEVNLRHRLLAKIINSYAYSYLVLPDGSLQLEWSMDTEPTTGYTLSEIRERGGLRQLIHPEDRERHRTELERVIAGAPAVIEFRIAGKDGGMIWLRSYNSPVRDGLGQRVVKIQGASQNITVQKQAEGQLAESERQYRQIFEGIAEGIYRSTPDGRPLLGNPALARMLGYDDPDQLLRRDIATEGYFDPAVRAAFVRMIEEAGAVRNFVNTWRRKDGTPLIVRENAHAVRAGDGRLLYYEGTVEDITAATQAEQALKESEANYRQIFENIAEGIFRTSPDGRVLLANPALVRMLGYGSAAELMAVNLERDGYVDPDNRQRFRQLLERDGEVWGYTSRWRRRDGAVITISENARMVRDADGSPRYYEGTVEDITEHIKADLALLDEKNKLSQLFDVSLSVARAGDVQEQLELTIKGLADLQLFKRMALVLKGDDGRNTNVAHLGLSDRDVAAIRTAPPASAEARAKIFHHKYRISNSYFIPHDDRDVQRQFSLQIATTAHLPSEWDANDNLLVPLGVKGKMIGYLSVDEPVDGKLPTLESVRLLELYANQAAISIENLRLYRDLEHSYYDTLKAFVAAMEAKDPYTKGHSENVRHYALKIARHLALPDEQVRLIDFSSLLHDIGKMAVKEDILTKPAALSDLEYEAVKLHPTIGSQMVAVIENLTATGPIIQAHHERVDGRGYPGGIRGEQIPIESRIISVADAYEAMTSDRPYRKAFAQREALRRLEQGSGTQFDRAIVAAFIEMNGQEQGHHAQG